MIVLSDLVAETARELHRRGVPVAREPRTDRAARRAARRGGGRS